MLQQDLEALNDRFFDNMDAEAIQLLVENQPDEEIDETQVWTRWVINPGLSQSTSLGRDFLVTQYGTATLQIFVPKGLYTGPGNDVRDQFNALFRGWRSPDKKLVVDSMKSMSSSYSKGTTEFHLINAMFNWHSKRRTSEA